LKTIFEEIEELAHQLVKPHEETAPKEQKDRVRSTSVVFPGAGCERDIQ
jgi:hypothetical protein